ncbi:MAG: quinoprotein relay system zinc metallohydrolase 2 [Gammaproteobacteria bacterium]|nr:quinoprotein relay system zinc metallohydrolase 2 [Gammaproteobacteria bacterium]
MTESNYRYLFNYNKAFLQQVLRFKTMTLLKISGFVISKLQLTKIVFSAILYFFMLFSMEHAFASSESKNFNLVELASGIYVHYGKHVSFESPDLDDIANIGFIVGDKCIAIIDTGGSVRIAQQLLSEIRRTSDKPVCYVINTHIHFDHLLGNIVFKDTEAEFVGHQNLADEIAANRSFFIREYGKNLGPQVSEDSIIGPDILVEEKMVLDLGNRKLQLNAYGAAHSHTDLTVFDEKTKTLWLSDLLFKERIPSLDGSLRGWLKSMDSFDRIDAEHIVPGHGPASTKSKDGYASQLQYLQLILEETRRGISQGLFMEDIVEQVGVNEKKKWLLHEQHHKRNVTKAFSELEWE